MKKIDDAKLHMSQFLMIIAKLSQENIPSKYLKLPYTSIATLRSLITKQLFQESIKTFLEASKHNSQQAPVALPCTNVFVVDPSVGKKIFIYRALILCFELFINTRTNVLISIYMLYF